MSKLVRRVTAISVIIAFLVGSTGVGLWLYSRAGASPAAAQTLSPKRTTLEHKIVASGTIVPRIEVKIKSHVNGVIDEIAVQPGQWVKQGDPVARIKPLADPVDINATQKELNQARFSLARAEVEFGRQRQLHAERLISEESFQDVRLKYQLAQESLGAAQRSLELKLKGATGKLGEGSTQVLATAAGMVLERPVELGDFIVKSGDLSEGTTIVTVADMNHLIFKGDVQEADAGRLQLGMPLSITVGALPEERFAAELEFIAPKARKSDQGRINFEVRAAVKPKSDLTLRAGYSAVAELVFARRENVLTIPESYLIFHGDKPYVKVEIAPGQIEERSVTTGISDGINLEVVSGLTEDDRLPGLEPGSAP